MPDIASALFDIADDRAFAQAYHRIDSVGTTDPRWHRRAAARLEALGEVESALKEYNLAVRDGGQDPEMWEQMADLYADTGRTRKAVRCHEWVLERYPERFATALRLSALLEELEEFDRSRALLASLLERTGDERYRRQLAHMDKTYFAARAEPEPEKEPWSDEIVLRFVDLFSGREGVHARQWVNDAGEAGYAPVHEHFTAKVAKNHLLGNYTVGCYQLRADDTVKWAAIDIDVEKKVWEAAAVDSGQAEALLAQALALARRIRAAFGGAGLPAYIEFSGQKGCHVWLFFASPLPASLVKVSLEQFLKGLPPPAESLHLELVPKQGKVKGEGLGNLIKLPLGVHLKTGKRSYFIDEDDAPFESPGSFLLSLKTVARDVFIKAIPARELLTPAKPVPAEAPAANKPPLQSTGATKASGAGPFDPFTSSAFAFLIAKCQVLALLVNKLQQTRQLSNDEKIVLKFTLGNLDEGVELVNHLFALIPGIPDTDLLKTRLSGNPISCPKIRKRLSEVTRSVDCACPFEDTDSYPNPLLHLRQLFKTPGAPLRPQEAQAVRFQHNLQQYLTMKNEINERRLAMRDIERYFHDHFDALGGTNEIHTSLGTLFRVFHPNGECEFVMKL